MSLPTTPYIGQQATVDGRTWEWTGTRWKRVAITVSTGAMERDVVSDVIAGAINPLDVVNENKTLTEVIEQLLKKIFEPTFTSPSASLINGNNQEVGTNYTFTLSISLNRGLIRGNLVTGVWQPLATQDFRAGAATSYVIDGTNIGLSTTREVTRSIVTGANTFNGTANYGIGPQPLNSIGGNFDSPLPAGSVNASRTIQGQRNLFKGTSGNPATSAGIRLLTPSLNPTNGSTHNLVIPVGATNVIFAYPATLNTASSIWYDDGNMQVLPNFMYSTVNVEGANGYAAISYRVYVYTPVEPFPVEVTYILTI